MNKLGMQHLNCVNDPTILKDMRDLIFHDGDVRPVWIGGGYAHTDVEAEKPYAEWANKHWGIYYSFMGEVDSFEGKTILDPGCGSGFCTLNLATLFTDSHVIATDIDKRSIDFCKQYNGHADIDYCLDDITTCDLPEEVDYIFFIEILEHVKNKYHYDLIDRLMKSLKTGGKLFISTPNTEEPIPGKKKGHIGLLTPAYYKAFFERYKDSIDSSLYIDNMICHTDEEDYVTDNPKKSHHRIIMTKRK